jgi:hypothetical protein
MKEVKQQPILTSEISIWINERHDTTRSEYNRRLNQRYLPYCERPLFDAPQFLIGIASRQNWEAFLTSVISLLQCAFSRQ